MKRLFLCHQSARLDQVRAFATELRLRGISPWVAPDGGFMMGDLLEREARRIIREDCYGLLLYATPGVLDRDFVTRVEMREAVRRLRREDLFRRLGRNPADPFVMAAVLDGIEIADLRRDSRQFLRHDLSRYDAMKLSHGIEKAAKGVLDERARRVPRGAADLTVQFSTRDPMPDGEADLLRIDAAAALRDAGDPEGWARIHAGLQDVKRALATAVARPTLWVHGSRHLTASFMLGRTFTRSSGFPLAVRARDGWWATTGAAVGPALRVTRRGEGAPVLAVRINATDKDVRPATDAFLSDRGARADRLDIQLDGPSLDAMSGRGFAAAVRAEVAQTVARTRTTEILIFAAVPQALAALIGHEWNGMPPTQLHEFTGAHYVRSMRV